MIDDPLLPAAAHLAGAEASDLLDAAVRGAGGMLLDARLVQVQHRPAHDVVARFEAVVSWAGGSPRAETLLAATTTAGAPDGTLPMRAEGLEAGVWRYPFDPQLPGLAAAVTPGRLAALLDGAAGSDPRLEVVAYRPIRRAVVRVVGSEGRSAFVKVVRPSQAEAIAAAHADLRAAGIPVPEVLAVDAGRGILVLAALAGENLRDRLLQATDGWPGAGEHLDLTDRLAAIPAAAVGAGDRPMALGPATRSHALALRAVLPEAGPVLQRIVPAVSNLPGAPASGAVTIHGDLYEAQLMVREGRVVGLLDLDDVGPGHPLDDLATTLAHLHLLRPGGRRHRDRLRRYRRALRTAFADERDGSGGRELDLRTGAVLTGLATGPFRAQSAGWKAEVHRRLAIAERLVRSAHADRERTLSTSSRRGHPGLREPSHGVATAPHPPTQGAAPWH